MAMTIPFLDLVKRAKEKFEGRRRPTGPAPLPSVEDKPESDKLAKRVMPYAVRTMTPEPTAPALAAASAIAARRIPATRPPVGTLGDLGPSAGVSVEPCGERTLSLALSDVITQMPDGYLKPHESFDTTRRVTLKAAEVEKGLAAGRPSILIAAIYQQAPEIFLHTVQPSDTAVVVLPAQKIIDELSHLRVREDQTAEPMMAQVETPFLKLMVEESAKFGTTVAPFTTTELTLPIEPSASKPAATQPAPASPPIQPPPAVRPPVAPTTSRTIPPPPIGTVPSQDGSTSRIVTPSAPAEDKPEKSLLIGTGGSAFPRVPASSGPPVPPAAPPAAAPTRIPFQIPPQAAPPKIAAQTPAPPPPVPEAPTVIPIAAGPLEPTQEPMVTLPLRPILASLPPMQVAGDVASVPGDAKISFRISLITPQLASGKVAISPKDFHAALPEQYRGLFLPDAVEAPVPLSLPDVLANLPGDYLRVREDQEVATHDEMFETPFLAKAKEDEERFARRRGTVPPAAAPAEPEVPKAEIPKLEPSEVAKAEALKVTIPPRQARGLEPVETADLQVPIPTANGETSVAKPAEAAPKFDAKAAVAQACGLSGVASCSVIFADGLIIAGNISDEMHMEGLSAVAPTMLKKLQKHMCETQLGPLSCMTVHGEKSPVTFFSAGDLCLTAVHNGTELSAESRRELSRITQELSRTYPQVETPHVDH